ncbi:MAG: hypothetical protein P0Y53_09820 [Candidatus Pseudobacter hemicellulosilyticus]|uniref:Uncharacterized protein n=1 Tax=Candidatus Pseudobacter hemicellulosilyticus TaxID=3121375 RepID=A0AAJ5WX29_9BACT|nr:MAG: hypothetical protein P0Y53_09820 [Pseudobacter sp.]
MTQRPIYILALGRNAEIMEVMQRLLNARDNWSGAAVTTDEEAWALLEQQSCAVMLLCAGISEAEEQAWKEKLALAYPATIVLRHYGGGSGLLENELLSVLNK